MTEKSNGAKVPTMKIVRDEDVVDQPKVEEVAQEVDEQQGKTNLVDPETVVKEEFDNFVKSIHNRIGGETGYFILVDVAGVGSFVGGSAPGNIAIGILEQAKYNILKADN